MYDDECVQDVPGDARADKMNQWINLDGAIKRLEGQKIEADLKLSELRPKRDKLGRQISEMVYPTENPMAEPMNTTKGDW